MPSDHHAAIRRILAGPRRVVVVGASPDPDRPSHGVVRRLVAAGYDVTPVNPHATEVAGLTAVPSLDAVEGPIDIVDVFRAAEHAPAIARAAVEAGAGALWLQQGVRSDEARAIATAAGLEYVEDACLAVEVERSGATPRSA